MLYMKPWPSAFLSLYATFWPDYTICSHGINLHCYVDDTWLNVTVRADDHTQMTKLEACLVVTKFPVSKIK